jgi:hypothetical protein
MVFKFLRSAYDPQLFTLPYSKCSICPPPAWIRASAWCLIATRRRSQIPATIRFRRVSTSSTGDKCTNEFKWPHKKKSSVYKSGERGGQAIGPPLPIHWPGNFRFRYLRTMRLKCARAPSCWMCSFLDKWSVARRPRNQPCCFPRRVCNSSL